MSAPFVLVPLAFASAQAPAPPQTPPQTAGAVLELVRTLEPALDVAEYAFVDLDGDRERELVLIGAGGELVVHASVPDEAAPLGGKPKTGTRLADPAHTLVTFANLDGEAGEELVVLSPDGALAYAFDAERGLAPVERLTRRARFVLRVGKPTLADFARDVNADGRPDLVLPAGEKLEVWIQGGAKTVENGTPARYAAFQRTAVVATQVSRWGARSTNELSDVLESSFSIPNLSVRDVNGDQRPDLYVVDGSLRAWHLQRQDGSFGETPDASVDVSLFRDTIEEAKVRPGHTLAISDDPDLDSRDLDGDGIPDYVIAHRRKVWVFAASAKGPQFSQPSTILKTADDITALQLVDLDDDQRPDLLLVKVQVPTVAELVRGVFGEWEVTIGATGYENVDGRSFSSTPKWKNELAVRLPAILKLFKNPEQFIQRFEETARRFRGGTIGDFDGDGRADVALVSSDRSELELWRGREVPGGPLKGSALDRGIARVLFEDPNTTWDLERIAGAFAGLAERRAKELTGSRPREAARTLRAREEFKLVALRNVDLDGDGKEEILAVYRTRASAGRLSVDVYRAR
ncbi:MAG: VCBS repeat-containing protein [Planctomycetes bacterium]|nr:VCBS repeat-containing protein [Planctomycetota bacterium]